MKKALLLVASLCAWGTATAQGIYQFADPGFEQYTASGQEPGNGWNSFNSAEGSVSGLGKRFSPMPQSVTPGANGSSRAVQIFSKNAVLAKANGNLTTGMINMGSTTPADAANYNFTKREDAAHRLEFAGRPDSVVFYAKFQSGGSPNGRGQFILHDDGCDYRDPEIDDQRGSRIGIATALIPASGDWVRYAAAFSYDKAQTATQYLLASFTTNPTPGGSQNDYLTIDDIRFVYCHELTALSYDGQSLDLTAAATANGVSMDGTAYSADKLTYTVKGAGATVETTFDEAAGKLRLTVQGNDFSVNPDSRTEYVITFGSGTTEPDPEVKQPGAPIASPEALDLKKTYVLYNPTFTAYAVSNPGKSEENVWVAGMQSGDEQHRVSDDSYSLAPDFAAPASAWMVIPFEGKYYLYNMGAKKFLTVPSQGENPAICKFTEMPAAVSLTVLSEGRFALNVTGEDQAFMCAAPQLSYPLSIWTSDDAGSCWQLMENPNVEADKEVPGLVDPSLVPALGDLLMNLDDASVEATYAVFNPAFTAYLSYSEQYSAADGYLWSLEMTGDDGHPLYTDNYAAEMDVHSPDAAWMVLSKDGSYYIYNVGCKKFLSTPGYTDRTQPARFSDAPVALTAEAVGEGMYALTATGHNLDYLCAAPQNEPCPLSTWSKDDSGAAWCFILNPNVEADAEVLDILNDQTGIQNAASTPRRTAVYTLDGRCLGTPQGRLPKGVYIKGGRKVVVR